LISEVEVDGVIEKDLPSNNWINFQITRPFSYYTIKEHDRCRPDLISTRVYGTQDYWWILMKYNTVDDIWNDITPDKVLECPHILDILDWINRST